MTLPSILLTAITMATAEHACFFLFLSLSLLYSIVSHSRYWFRRLNVCQKYRPPLPLSKGCQLSDAVVIRMQTYEVLEKILDRTNKQMGERFGLQVSLHMNQCCFCSCCGLLNPHSSTSLNIYSYIYIYLKRQPRLVKTQTVNLLIFTPKY